MYPKLGPDESALPMILAKFGMYIAVLALLSGLVIVQSTSAQQKTEVQPAKDTQQPVDAQQPTFRTQANIVLLGHRT